MYMVKMNSKYRAMCKIYWKYDISDAPESSVFAIDFEHNFIRVFDFLLHASNK